MRRSRHWAAANRQERASADAGFIKRFAVRLRRGFGGCSCSRKSRRTGRAIRAQVVCRGAPIVSNRRCALRAPRFPIVFPGSGRGVVERVALLQLPTLASWTVIRRHPLPKDCASGLSSIPNSPVQCARLPNLGLSGFTPRRQIAPTVSAHSKVSDVFEISRVRTRR